VTDDRITAPKLGGILLGFGGLSLLMAPALVKDGLQATTWGLIAISIAAASYGVGMVYARNHLRGLPPLVAPTAQLGVATLYMLPLSLFFERPFSLPLPSWPALASLFSLSFLGTTLAFIIYYHLLEKTSATYLSMVTYLIPVIGVVLGVAVLNEQLSWNVYLGCALILVGVMIVNGVFRFITWRRLTEAPVRSSQ